MTERRRGNHLVRRRLFMSACDRLEARMLLTGQRVAYVVAGLGGRDYPVDVVNFLIGHGFTVHTPWWNSTTPAQDDPQPDPNHPGKFTPYVNYGDSDPGSFSLTPGTTEFQYFYSMNLGLPSTSQSFVSAVVNDLEANYDANDLVVLIGHGLGSDSLLKVTDKLAVDAGKGLTTVNVDLLATLDPMGFVEASSNPGLLEGLSDGTAIGSLIPETPSPRIQTSFFQGKTQSAPFNSDGQIPAVRAGNGAVPSTVKYLYNRWQTNAILPYDFNLGGTLSSQAQRSTQTDFEIADQAVSNQTAVHPTSELEQIYRLASLTSLTSTAHMDGDFPQDQVIQQDIETILGGLIRQSFVVTTTVDLVSGRPADGSLRAVIINANRSSGTDTITFDIKPRLPVETIVLNAVLPAITEAVTIDGTTQPGYQGRPVVVVDGSRTTGDGLVFALGGNTLIGLAVGGFSGAGVRLQAGGNNSIAGSNIGTDATGQAPLANEIGVLIEGGTGTTIGGTTAGAGNLISGNSTAGIYIKGSSADRTLIVGNRIGTEASGRAPLANGIGVLIQGGTGTTIGGTTTGAGNTLSGNNTAGVYIDGSSTSGSQIVGNRIGTDPAGQSAVKRSGQTAPLKALQNAGIVIVGSQGNSVGGTTAEARNVISGNYAGLVIASISGQGNNRILGNFIGTDVSGLQPLGNVLGIYINGAAGNQVGGTAPGSGNVISANTTEGIELFAAASTANAIQGNLIGLAADGTGVFRTGDGNFVQQNGILIEDASGNLVGGAEPGAGNVITGNGGAGLYIFSRMGRSRENLVQGNFIGTGPNGVVGPGNGAYGVLLYNAPGNQVTVAGANANRFGSNGIINIRFYNGAVPASTSAAARTNRASTRKTARSAHPAGPAPHRLKKASAPAHRPWSR